MGIVKHFADLYHAKIAVNSTLDVGTEVIVKFPKSADSVVISQPELASE
jgi:signal transduction histidine kinase